MGNFVLFGDAWAIVFSLSGEVIGTAHELNGHFILDTNADGKVKSLSNKIVKKGRDILEQGKKMCLVSTASDKTDVWHRRFGHLNFKSLYHMQNANVVKGLDGIHLKENDCKVCLTNKMSETKYPNVENPAKEILERVHSDICGPFRTASLCGAKYLCSFIDEKSRMVKVYPLKSRDGAAAAFGDYKTFVENQSGRKIKCVRTDNAPEYVGGEFARIVKESGTLHQRSARIVRKKRHSRADEQNTGGDDPLSVG